MSGPSDEKCATRQSRNTRVGVSVCVLCCCHRLPGIEKQLDSNFTFARFLCSLSSSSYSSHHRHHLPERCAGPTRSLYPPACPRSTCVHSRRGWRARTPMIAQAPCLALTGGLHLRPAFWLALCPWRGGVPADCRRLLLRGSMTNSGS